ncbi:MAG: hypothetical protein N2508_03895 [Anaerolineae bacterium]|nr:hypothetical protein [Anaerolineae bacterium]
MNERVLWFPAGQRHSRPPGTSSSASAGCIPGTPFFYVVDEEGVIVNRGFGNMQAQLEALVRGGVETKGGGAGHR